jgi:hypothetical protein
MQPLIYNSLVSHCRGTIDGRARTGFTILACRKAAQSVLDEVKKYESYLCSPLTRLGQILDPRIGNGSDMALDIALEADHTRYIERRVRSVQCRAYRRGQ